MSTSDFLTPHDAAVRWGVSLRTVRSMIASGELEAVRIGPRSIRIPVAAVHAAERPYADGPRSTRQEQVNGPSLAVPRVARPVVRRSLGR